MPEYCTPERGRMALLTLSVQRDFTTPGLPMTAPGLPRVLPNIQRVVQYFRNSGRPIYHSIRLYRPDGSNVDVCRRQAVEEGLRVFMPGTFGAELVDDIKPSPDIRLAPDQLLSGEFQDLGPQEQVFYRPRWSAFFDTTLEASLRARGVTTVAICGFGFSTGFRATIYEASARDFRIVLLPDAVAGADEASIRELGRLGVYLIDTAPCLRWLDDGPGRETGVNDNPSEPLPCAPIRQLNALSAIA